MLESMANTLDGQLKPLQPLNTQISVLRHRIIHNQEGNTKTSEDLILASTRSHEVTEPSVMRSKSYSMLTRHLNPLEADNMSDIETMIKEKSATNHGAHAKRSLSESSVSQKRSDCAKTKTHNKMWCNEMTLNPNSSKVQPDMQGNRFKYLSWNRWRISDVIDVGVRVAMVIFFVHLESRPSFRRKIAVEQMWQYKYPRSPDIVTAHALLISVIFVPFLTTIAMYLLTRNRRDFRAASWVWTLALCLNGIATSLLKVTVGRPRPDFFARCFPDVGNLSTFLNNPSLMGTANVGVYNFNCTGNAHDVNEGYKSFPSGHSSFAFTSYGFVSIYVGSKLHTFTSRGRGETWRLFITILPTAVAALVAVSRTCDYHHHYEDVIVGGIIGLFSTYMAYRQYYPSIFSDNAHVCFARGNCNSINILASTNSGYKHLPSTDEDDEAAAGGGDRYSGDMKCESEDGVVMKNDEDCALADDGGDKPNKWI